MMWCGLAPIAMRRPISRVRSVTLTSMMFMMPMPPTSSETPAMAASRLVNVAVLSACALAISVRLRIWKSSGMPAAGATVKHGQTLVLLDPLLTPEAKATLAASAVEAEGQVKSAATITQLMASVAAVSLLIAGIGIMNIMLVSVTERTREIGLRMAVGAKPRNILLQFLVEALSLSMVGGLLGMALGMGGAWLADVLGWPTTIRPDIVAIALGFSAFVGVVFGLYPAYKASQLDPIDALRFE